MSTRVEIELDDQGRLALPVLVARRLGLAQGTTLVVEQETSDAAYLRIQNTGSVANSVVVDKGGVLVITVLADRSLDDSLRSEREQRLDTLWDHGHARLT